MADESIERAHVLEAPLGSRLDRRRALGLFAGAGVLAAAGSAMGGSAAAAPASAALSGKAQQTPNVAFPTSDDDRVRRRDVRKGDPMQYDVTGTGSVKSRFQLGRYNPTFWNESGYIEANNCYAYACNIRLDNHFPDPGYGSIGRLVSGNKELLDGVRHDGLVRIDGGQPERAVDGTVESPAWMVALFSGIDQEGNFGYHFFRKVWLEGDDYCWAHKFGDDHVTNLSVSKNHYIRDPEKEIKMINAKNSIDYNLTGWFLVSPTATVWAPPT